MAITMHATATETASGVGPSQGISSQSLIGVFINVSALTGLLPSVTIKLQQSPDGTDWYDVQSFTSGAIGAVGLTALYPSITAQKLGDFARVAWTIGGTAGQSVTFSAQLMTAP